jgi:hypothetical protein
VSNASFDAIHDIASLSGTIAFELFSTAASLERLGVHADPILEQSGVPLGLRDDVHARVPLEAEYTFWGHSITMGSHVVTLADDRAHIELSEADGLAQIAIWRDGPQRARSRIEMRNGHA